jgi:hypothetical protein
MASVERSVATMLRPCCCPYQNKFRQLSYEFVSQLQDCYKKREGYLHRLDFGNLLGNKLKNVVTARVKPSDLLIPFKPGHLPFGIMPGVPFDVVNCL